MPYSHRAASRTPTGAQKRNPARPVCPYCEREARFLPSSETIYGRDYGPVYVCVPCDARVGCHRGTTRPLGRLANAELRLAKRGAHDAFDRTWRALHEERTRADPSFSKSRTRAKAYKRLAILLEIDARECHIGMFDLQQCARVITLCAAGTLAPEHFAGRDDEVATPSHEGR